LDAAAGQLQCGVPARPLPAGAAGGARQRRAVRVRAGQGTARAGAARAARAAPPPCPRASAAAAIRADGAGRVPRAPGGASRAPLREGGAEALCATGGGMVWPRPIPAACDAAGRAGGAAAVGTVQRSVHSAKATAPARAPQTMLSVTPGTANGFPMSAVASQITEQRATLAPICARRARGARVTHPTRGPYVRTRTRSRAGADLARRCKMVPALVPLVARALWRALPVVPRKLRGARPALLARGVGTFRDVFPFPVVLRWLRAQLRCVPSDFDFLLLGASLLLLCSPNSLCFSRALGRLRASAVFLGAPCAAFPRAVAGVGTEAFRKGAHEVCSLQSELFSLLQGGASLSTSKGQKLQEGRHAHAKAEKTLTFSKFARSSASSCLSRRACDGAQTLRKSWVCGLASTGPRARGKDASPGTFSVSSKSSLRSR